MEMVIEMEMTKNGLSYPLNVDSVLANSKLSLELDCPSTKPSLSSLNIDKFYNL